MANNPFEDLVPNQQNAKADPFADLVPQQAAQSEPPVQEVQPDLLVRAGQTLSDSLEAFNRSFDKLAAGSIYKVGAGLDKLGVPGGAEIAHTAEQYNTAQDQSLQQAQTRSPIATQVAGTLGDLGAGVAYTAPAMATSGAIAPIVASTALTGAQYAAPIQEDSTSAGMTGLALGLLGSVAGVAGGALISKLAKRMPDANIGPSGHLQKLFSPQTAAESDVAFNIKNAMNETGNNPQVPLDAAKRLGTWVGADEALGVIPDEAGTLTSIQRIASGLTNTPANREYVGKQIGERASILGQRGQEVVESFTPKGLAETQATNKIYRTAMQNVNVSDDALNAIKSDPKLHMALDNLNSDTTASLSQLPDNNLAKLDALKQNIDDMLWKDAKGLNSGTKSLAANEVQDLRAARDKLVTVLNDSPIGDGVTYADARKVSQQLILRNKVDEALASKAGGDSTLKAYKQALFQNPRQQEVFLDSLAEAGGDVAKAKDLITVLDAVSKSQVGASLKIGLSKNFGVNILQGLLTPDTYRDAITPLIMEPAQWGKIVDKILAAPKSKQAEYLVDGIQTVKSAMTDILKNQKLDIVKTAGKTVVNRFGGYPVIGGIGYLSSDKR